MSTRNAHVNMIWGLLSPYIASDDPPDLSIEEQAEILTAGALPQVWELVLKIERDLDARAAVVEEYQGRGYHPPMERCPHAMTRWIGDHCAFESRALAALEQQEEQ